MTPAPELDQAMAMAWPAAETVELDGWVLRATEGVTRRANSVLVRGEPSDLAAAHDTVLDFYRSRDLEPTFLVSDASAPDGVVRFLEECGYRGTAATWLLSSALLIGPTADHDWALEVADTPSEEWFDAYWSVEGSRRTEADRTIVRRVLLQPDVPARFVTVGDADGVVSVGQVVVAGGWGCVQCLATVPAGRRRGAGRVVVDELAAAAVRLGAAGVFAAVMAENEASLGLFERASFVRRHQYRYFMR